MNRPVPIPAIAGVPAQLVATINNRLLLMQQGAASDIAAVSKSAAAAAAPATSAAAGTGSNLALYANGTLGIQADAAPALWLYAAVTPVAIAAYVKTAPTGAGISVTIYAGAAAWATLTIAAGATQSAPITLPGALAAGVQIRLAITAVGTTIPGADLSVFVYT